MINKVNLVGSWVSIFVLSWLLITKKLPVDALSLTFFAFFLIIAFFATDGNIIVLVIAIAAGAVIGYIVGKNAEKIT